MINLIPKEEKRKMIRSFYYRLAVVYLLALALPVFIGVIVMIPSYFLVRTKADLVDKKLEVQKNEPVPLLDQKTSAVIEDLDRKLSLIESNEDNKFLVSERVINSVVLKKMRSIKITDISYEDDSKNKSARAKKVSIQGTAPSREVLLLFRKALEDDSAFSSVDLPVSNFVKGSNIQFYLSLIPRPNDAVGQASQ